MVFRLFRNRILVFAALTAMAGGLSGCFAAVLGFGAGTTAMGAAAQERGLKGTANDTVIRARINELWLDHSFEMLQNVGLRVVEGRVLLTGKVRTQQMRLDAVRLAWKAKGVAEVINEIQVTTEGGIVNYARDAWVSTQLRTTLLLDQQVASINYSVETVNGVIFLMGIAQDQTELDRVTNHARSLEYVKKVISYIRLKSDPKRRNRS